MNSSYLTHLDAMLANAIWESMQANPSDQECVLHHLEKLEKLSATNTKLNTKLRGAIDWALNNVEFDPDDKGKLSKQLEALGGPVAQQTPIPENQTNQGPTPLVIEPANQILSNELQPGWTRVYGTQLEEFLLQITFIDGKYKTSPMSTVVDWRRLPFYNTAALIRVHDPMWVNSKMVIYYLTDQGNLYRLNGTSPPIHEINNKAPIQLNENNVLDYLRFFCFFVRGDEGPFYVLERSDDPLIPETESATTLSIIEGTAHPAKLESMDEEGNFLCQALVFYSNALFEGSFKVKPTGMLEMLNDEPIAGDLDCKIDAPIA